MIHVLNTLLEVVGIIDDYYSLTWTERHYEAGDFEVDLPTRYMSETYMTQGNFLTIQDSDVVMMIENIKPVTTEEKKSLVVSGQSTESLLKRRSLSVPFDADGFAETIMYTLVDEHLVNPTDSERGMLLLQGTTSAQTLTPVYQNQVEMGSIYDICVAICKDTGLGFRIKRTLHLGTESMAFEVYEGVDRSFNQSALPWVIFSESFDNIISGSFYESTQGQVNLVQVITDDSWPAYRDWKVWAVGESEPQDLERREKILETSVDRDLGGTSLTNLEVLAILETRARAVIFEHRPKGLFEGAFDFDGNFKYGVDFHMGDIVQVSLSGHETPARIIELVRSYSVDGITTHVTTDFIDI